jgi:hypothetical protein
MLATLVAITSRWSQPLARITFSCALPASGARLLVTHVISVLVVLPNFWNPLLFMIPFWRVELALVYCYV